MKNKKLWAMLILAVACVALIVLTSHIYHGGPWRGKVVDAETGEPIEGAAVVARWQWYFKTPAGASFFYLDASEAVTDKNGDFEIKDRSFLYIAVVHEIYGPEIYIYSPGYGSFPGNAVYPVYPDYASASYFEKKDAVVKLPRFTNKDDRRKALHGAESVLEIPLSRIPNMLNLVNEENKHLGFITYEEEAR